MQRMLMGVHVSLVPMAQHDVTIEFLLAAISFYGIKTGIFKNVDFQAKPEEDDCGAEKICGQRKNKSCGGA